MLERRIERAAAEFWRQAGETPAYPVDMQRMVLFALPLDVHLIARLSVARLAEWAAERHIACRLPGRDRRLRGCLVARRGCGILFVDGADPPEEQRFTLAHEAAHFLLDYDAPRRRVLAALGPAVLPVLDGDRQPTAAERIDALLGSTPLGTHTHLMERGPHGALGQTAAVECSADALALEILAPHALAAAMVREQTAQRSTAREHQTGGARLAHAFGLPLGVAEGYARSLARGRGTKPSVAAWLGIATDRT